MTIEHLKNIYRNCPPNTALLGLDVGKKTIGIAVCDSEQSVAMPVATIKRKKLSKDVLELAKFIKDYSIGGYIIGYPVNVDGSEGPRCQSVKDFALEFARFENIVGSDPWIALWDERFSTEIAEEHISKTLNTKKRKAKQSGLTDKLAAQYILMTALDFIKNKNS